MRRLICWLLEHSDILVRHPAGMVMLCDRCGRRNRGEFG